MSTSWPKVVGYLLTAVPTLPGWAGVSVYDGHPVTGDTPTDYLTVGYITADDHGGTFTRNSNPDGSGTDETGEVHCHLACQSGDPLDLPAVRTRAFALAGSLDTALSADQTLGGVLVGNATTGLTVNVLTVQASSGVAQSLLLVVHYSTTDYPF